MFHHTSNGGWLTLDPLRPPGWPILAGFARVGLPFASFIFSSYQFAQPVPFRSVASQRD